MTKREQIMEAVETGFQNITIANGYNTNLGNNVRYYETGSLSESEIACLLFQDVSNELIERMANKFFWQITVQANLVLAGDITPAGINSYLSDVYKALSQDITWGGLAVNTIPARDEIMAKEEGQIYTVVRVEFFIQYLTNEWEI